MVNQSFNQPQTPVADPLAGEETMLVVDDESAVRSTVARALRNRGYNVIEATNGADAIDQAGRHAARIHLVLTDIVMPEMSGRELFDRLRGWYPSLRVLFMSGYIRGESTEREVHDEATSFIAKPFLSDELAVAIRRLLDAPHPSSTHS